MPFTSEKNWEGSNAPEFPDDLEWLNSEPLKIKNLNKNNKIVLLDFWTYSCVNCIRTLPYLVEWDEKYRDLGLIIIGVHSPEFGFEKNTDNIKQAINEFSIEYPVVVDAEHQVWNLWSNNVWPRKFLINTEGKVIYDHKGEGGYAETELKIQETLKEIHSNDLDLPNVSEDAKKEKGKVCYPTTPETYLGSLRGAPGETWNYEGVWERYDEYITHTANTENYIDYLEINYQAITVNLVASAEGKESNSAEESSTVKVELNGQPVPPEARGKDIKEENGETIMYVSNPKMYNVVSADAFHEGELRFYTKSANLRFYAFTFGGCEGGHI